MRTSNCWKNGINENYYLTLKNEIIQDGLSATKTIFGRKIGKQKYKNTGGSRKRASTKRNHEK